MAKVLSDGNIKVTFVPNVAVLSAPTVDELTAADIIACEEQITADGLSISIEQGAVEGDTLASTQTFQGPGRTQAQIELTYFKDGVAANNRMWTVMANGAPGYLVVRKGISYETPYEADQKVAIYTVTCGEPSDVPFEAETYERARVTLYPSGPYLREATVAA